MKRLEELVIRERERREQCERMYWRLERKIVDMERKWESREGKERKEKEAREECEREKEERRKKREEMRELCNMMNEREGGGGRTRDKRGNECDGE